jgi:hypothetical protein
MSSKEIVASVFIIMLATLLVIGRHFDAAWAGGEGYRERSEVIVLERSESVSDIGCEAVDPSRENILSCGARMKIAFGSSIIWMDEKTSLVVINDREGLETLALYGGRIVVEGPIMISARDLGFTTTGSMTLVNYGWLQRIDALALDGAGSMSIDEQTTILDSGKAMSFDTVPPYDPAKTIDFSTESTSVKDFYDWAKE